MSIDDRTALEPRIRAGIERSGRYLLTQPSEVAAFSGLSDDQLREYAAEHGWIVVPHLDRTQIEFCLGTAGQTT